MSNINQPRAEQMQPSRKKRELNCSVSVGREGNLKGSGSYLNSLMFSKCKDDGDF